MRDPRDLRDALKGKPRHSWPEILLGCALGLVAVVALIGLLT